MCGIAGITRAGITPFDHELIQAMLQDLARRGPDADAVHAWPRTVFGHRRLAIFDLSDDGRQPMLTEDGRLGVVFNGAIYNFRQLRRELETAGYPFRTQTDTEV